MALLMLARQHFLWWPLHPLGFAVSTISMTNYISFSVFLAWLIKTVILKYGGPVLFRHAKPNQTKKQKPIWNSTQNLHLSTSF